MVKQLVSQFRRMDCRTRIALLTDIIRHRDAGIIEADGHHLDIVAVFQPTMELRGFTPSVRCTFPGRGASIPLNPQKSTEIEGIDAGQQ
jgi:hypothetical protein